MKARWQLFELQLLVENNDIYISSNLPFYTRALLFFDLSVTLPLN